MQSEIKDVSIHPGVVLAEPNPATNKFPVAMISNKLPYNPPQTDIKHFYHGTGLDGNVRLAPPKQVENVKPWKHKLTGGRQSPTSKDGLNKLEAEMGAHFSSRSTIFCLFLISCSERRKQRFSPNSKRIWDEQNTKISKKLQNNRNNAQASSSRYTPPVHQRSQQPPRPHVNAQVSSSRFSPSVPAARPSITSEESRPS